ncbi:MAG: DUF2846 domain-containing protein [Betaproteobacteria bacterium]|nr:DUF2846 domain-containing protein [Betaproteobacteria bacterium]
MTGTVRALTAIVGALLVLAGCASTPQASDERDAEAKRFLTHPNAATIYVYRGDIPTLEGDSVLVINGRLIGATLPGTFFRVDVRAGVNVIEGAYADVGRMTLHTHSGGLYLVSLTVAAGHSHFALVSPERGKQAVLACCALLENWAPGQRPLLR